MTPSRSSSRASDAGSWSTVSASVRDSAAASSSSASRPASRSARPSNRLSSRAIARASRTAPATASRAPPSAVSASWTAAEPRAIASPCCAAASRALISSASPGRSPGRRDLARLVLEHLEPPGELARVDDQLVEGGPVGAPGRDGGLHGPAQLLVPAEPVEQVALPALVEEVLLVVLAVDLDERPDLVGEPRGRHGLVVEPAPWTVRRRPPRGRRSAAREAGRTAPPRGRSRRRAGPATCRRAPPIARPSASISRLLPAPVSPVMTLKPRQGQADALDDREVA